MKPIQTTKIYTELTDAVKKGFTLISEQGSSRSAKTYNTIIWLILYCLSNPGTRLSIVRGTLPALKGSVLVDFREIMTKMEIYEERRCFNKSELIYTLDNGSWIEFFSADMDQKLRGRKRDVLFVNEANELGFMEWQQLKMRTTRFSIIDYNPSFGEEHWINDVNKDQRTYHFITTYRDNPFLEQTVVDEIESLKEKNPSLWRIYGLGLQSQVEGLVFPSIEIVKDIPDTARWRRTGIDFGFTNDPTAIVNVAVEGNTLYIDEAVYLTDMLSTDIIRALKQYCGGMKTIAESADPRLVQEIYRAGIDIHPVKKFPGSIEAGLSKMSEYKIAVTKRSANVIKEFRNYTWSRDKEGKWLNKPIDMYNHAIDAVRYVVMNEIMGGSPRKIDTARLGRLV